MKSILLVEDDLSLGQILSERLLKDYSVTWKQTYQEALTFFIQNMNLIDVVLMDVGLPDGNGFDLAKKIRDIKHIPLIFLTAQSDAESRLTGFEIGAEEFIPKPFHLKELLIRLNHVLDQHVILQDYKLEHVTIHFNDMSITSNDGKLLYPSLTDMKILKTLIEKSPRILSRDDLINDVWGEDKMISHRTIDNIIARLRQLLGGDYIRSIRGTGYQWSQHLIDSTNNKKDE
jgi:two-component system, OmpR family, phosphate regulon response regulator PhoB